MTNDQKILNILEKQGKALDALQGSVTTIQADLKDVKQTIAHTTSAVDALKAGQDDIRDKMATKADVMDLGAKIDRITKNHERRIEELEKRAGLPNPYKN